MDFDFITGTNRFDSHVKSGEPYAVGRFEDIVMLAKAENEKPEPHSPKDHYWAVPVKCSHAMSRSASWLKREDPNTQVSMVWADIDRGDPSWDQVWHFANTVANGGEFLVYTSRSHGEIRTEDDVCEVTGLVDKAGTKKQKYRILWPLAEESLLNVVNYTAAAQAIIDYAQEKHGLTCDPVVRTVTQLCYLPNRGTEYLYFHSPSFTRLSLRDHFLIPYIEKVMETEHAEELAAAQRRADFEANGKQETAMSPIAAFRRKHPATPEMMEWLGFDTVNGVDWRMAGGGSYATQIKDDGALYTLSSTVGALGGKQAGQGWYFQDVYYLFMHRMGWAEHPSEHEDGQYSIREYANQCLQEERKTIMGDATPEHGKQVWENCQTINGSEYGPAGRAVAIAEAKAATPPAKPVAGTEEHQWDFEYPYQYGMRETAEWAFSSSSRPVRQFAAMMTYTHYSSIIGAKYHFDGMGLNLFSIIGGGTGTGKGSAFAAQQKIVAGMEQALQDFDGVRRVFSNQPPASMRGIRQMFDGDFESRMAYLEDADSLMEALMDGTSGSNGQTLRSGLSTMWDKSGPNDVTGSVSYAKKDDKVLGIRAPNLQLGLDTQMAPVKQFLGTRAVMLGFGQRFIYSMYEGKPFKAKRIANTRRDQKPPASVVEHSVKLWRHCQTIIQGQSVAVQAPEEVYVALDELETKYLAMVQQDVDGAVIANRMHVQVAKLAAIQAVADNPDAPVISIDHFRSALSFVEIGYNRCMEFIANGEVGSGELVRVAHIMKAADGYLSLSPKQRMSYRQPKQLAEQDVVLSETYFLKRLHHSAHFKGVDSNASASTPNIIRATLNEAVQQGYLMEIDPSEAMLAAGVLLDGRVKGKLYIKQKEFNYD